MGEPKNSIFTGNSRTHQYVGGIAKTSRAGTVRKFKMGLGKIGGDVLFFWGGGVIPQSTLGVLCTLS